MRRESLRPVGTPSGTHAGRQTAAALKARAPDESQSQARHQSAGKREDRQAEGRTPEASEAQQAAARAAARRAVRILLARQDDQGWWSGRQAGDVTLDAEAVLVREFLGTGSPALAQAAAQRIRSLQQPEGSWIGGPDPDASCDLPASVLAYLALRLAGDSPDAYHMAVAAGWIRDAGGLAAAGLSTRMWLAVFGLISWADVRVPAPEGIFLPARQIRAGGGWTGCGHQEAVALSIVGTLRPVRRLAADLTELLADSRAVQDVRARSARMTVRSAGLTVSVSVAQRAALRRCGQWLLDWQRAGPLVGRRPVLPSALIALHVLGYPLREPVLCDGLAWLDSVTARPRPPARPDGPAFGTSGRHVRLAAERQPPVRETALAALALADAGLPAGATALVGAGSWLLTQRVEGPADGTGPQPDAGPYGWTFGRDGYPDVAGTAQVLLALSRIDLPGASGAPAVLHAIRWLAGTQGRDGCWERSALSTVLAVQALAAHGAGDGRALRRGVVWLLRAQRADGAWAGQDGAADLRVTAAAVPALLAAGVMPGKPPVRSAVGWLLSRQNLDAGWPGTAAARAGRGQGRGRSDPDATALALTALLAAGGTEVTDPADLAADWLVRAQHADGGWQVASADATRPGAQAGSRRRGPLTPGLLQPLAALGQYAVVLSSAETVPTAAGAPLH
jgi:squalene-hopene/tetraprenyl-beta-curcumene cyclase